jgi:hypothetical protein
MQIVWESINKIGELLNRAYPHTDHFQTPVFYAWLANHGRKEVELEIEQS